MTRLVLVACAAVLSAGCGILDSPKVCTADFRYGLVVRVVDSASGTAPDSASLVATSPGFVDSVGPVRPAQMFADSAPALYLLSAPERPGFYNIEVSSPGYQDWRRQGIRVTADECHVRRVNILARLQH